MSPPGAGAIRAGGIPELVHKDSHVAPLETRLPDSPLKVPPPVKARHAVWNGTDLLLWMEGAPDARSRAKKRPPVPPRGPPRGRFGAAGLLARHKLR